MFKWLTHTELFPKLFLPKIEDTDNSNENTMEEPFSIYRGQPAVFHALLPLLDAQLHHCFHQRGIKVEIGLQ